MQVDMKKIFSGIKNNLNMSEISNKQTLKRQSTFSTTGEKLIRFI